VTHILVLYDGETGDYENLDMFLKWIQSLNSKKNINGVERTYNVSPRLLLPINLRVCEHAKEELLEDLKMLINERLQEKLDKIPGRKLAGIEKIDMKKYKRKMSPRECKIDGYPRGCINNVHINIIGEIKDQRRNDNNEESL